MFSYVSIVGISAVDDAQPSPVGCFEVFLGERLVDGARGAPRGAHVGSPGSRSVPDGQPSPVIGKATRDPRDCSPATVTTEDGLPAHRKYLPRFGPLPNLALRNPVVIFLPQKQVGQIQSPVESTTPSSSRHTSQINRAPNRHRLV